MKARRRMVFFLPLMFAVAACAAESVPEAAAAAEATEMTETTIIDIPNAIMIEDGILSGGQPDEAQLRQAAEAGYRTIVNMRGPGEEGSLEGEEELVRSLGMEYVSLPIAGGEAINETNARKLAEILEQPDLRPAMLHCRSGNRIGILYAAKAFVVDGLDADAALEYGTASGMRKVPEQLHAILGVGQAD